MNTWKKINKQEMTQIKGGGFLISVWALTLTSVVVVRSLFADKASLSMNGVGKASWEEEKSKKETSKINFNDKDNHNNHLEAFISKFYAV